MTFTEWQATRAGPAILTADQGGVYAGEMGWLYDGGFLTRTAEGFMVPLPQEELTFATLDEAERVLWAEWCESELNG